MLPDDGKALSAIVDKFAPSEEAGEPIGLPDEGSEIDTVAQELIDAVQAGDATAVASALRAAFTAFEAEPHAEAAAPEGE